MCHQHRLCCGPVSHSRIPDTFSGASLAVRARTEFLIRPDAYGRSTFCFNPNSFKLPILKDPVYNTHTRAQLDAALEENPNGGLLVTGPRAWGDSVQAVDWHFGLTQLANDSPQYKSTETWETSNTKRSVAFDECFKFATNYRVSNARLVVRYIGHPDKSQGRFVLKEFVPKGEIHKQYSLDDQWPTSEDEIALKTTHVKAADGFLFTPLVHNQKKNELFVDFDDKGFLEGTEPADDTSWGSGTSTVLDHTANWLKMAKGAEARESQKGLESCMVFLTGAMSSTNVDLEGQACWSVEIVQDVEVQIKTGAFAERMATPSPLYDPYYAQTQERINTELRAQGSNVRAGDPSAALQSLG